MALVRRGGNGTFGSFLSLDLGTTTGWAQTTSDGLKSGTWSVKPSRFESSGMRFLKWEKKLQERFEEAPFEILVFEEVRAHKGVDAAHAYGGFLAILSAWCEKNSVPYSGVPVGVIKKFITGKGNANKATVIEAVNKKGFSIKDDNEADAVALLLYAQKNLI